MKDKKDLYEGLGCMFILFGITAVIIALSYNYK
jgi:hypothetical protein